MIKTVDMKMNFKLHSGEGRWLNVYTQTQSYVQQSWIITTAEIILKPIQLTNKITKYYGVLQQQKCVNRWFSNHADKQSGT